MVVTGLGWEAESCYSPACGAVTSSTSPCMPCPGSFSHSPSFFFMLLEHYGLQLHHLLPHSITLVAIFVHLYEMYR
jgi:hypothetical protein